MGKDLGSGWARGYQEVYHFFLAVEGFSGSAVVGLHESGIRAGFRLLTLGS